MNERLKYDVVLKREGRESLRGRRKSENERILRQEQ